MQTAQGGSTQESAFQPRRKEFASRTPGELSGNIHERFLEESRAKRLSEGKLGQMTDPNG